MTRKDHAYNNRQAQARINKREKERRKAERLGLRKNDADLVDRALNERMSDSDIVAMALDAGLEWEGENGAEELLGLVQDLRNSALSHSDDDPLDFPFQVPTPSQAQEPPAPKETKAVTPKEALAAYQQERVKPYSKAAVDGGDTSVLSGYGDPDKMREREREVFNAYAADASAKQKNALTQLQEAKLADDRKRSEAAVAERQFAERQAYIEWLKKQPGSNGKVRQADLERFDQQQETAWESEVAVEMKVRRDKMTNYEDSQKMFLLTNTWTDPAQVSRPQDAVQDDGEQRYSRKEFEELMRKDAVLGTEIMNSNRVDWS